MSDEPQVAIILNNLGLNYKAQGKFAIAEPQYLQVLPADDAQLAEYRETLRQCKASIESRQPPP